MLDKHQNDLNKLAANQTKLELLLKQTTNRLDSNIDQLKEKLSANAEKQFISNSV